MAAGNAATVYARFLRDRVRSTVWWTLGLVIIIVATAAFYPSLGASTGGLVSGSGEGMSTFLGLQDVIDPGTPLGYLWISLYANIYPWVLMALGIAVGVAAIAGDEDTGTLEYLLRSEAKGSGKADYKGRVKEVAS